MKLIYLLPHIWSKSTSIHPTKLHVHVLHDVN